MSDEQIDAVSAADLLKNSLLYRHAVAQHEEILKHKWYESEKAGYDIGLARAKTDWTVRHRSQWLKWWLQERAGAAPGVRTARPSA
jgi:hypothetical protein